MEKWTLEEVENSIQAQLDFLSKGGKDGDQFEADWLPCYTALAQVKQAQALEQIAKHGNALEQIARTLKGLDDNSIVTREK